MSMSSKIIFGLVALSVVWCGGIVAGQVYNGQTRCSTMLRYGGYCTNQRQKCGATSYEYRPFSNLLGCSRATDICCAFYNVPNSRQGNIKAPIVPVPPQTCGLGSGVMGTRILNGRFTQPCDWPFVVSLRARKRGATTLSYGDSMHACAGVLIANNWVLTTPFCLLSAASDEAQAPSNVMVVAGEYNVTGIDYDPINGTQQEQLLQVQRAIIHPSYAYRTLSSMGIMDDTLKINSHAVALLKLAKPISGRCNGVACLPSDKESSNMCASHDNCVITGWGFATEEISADKLIQTMRMGRNRLSSKVACDFLSNRLGLANNRPAGTICQGMPQRAGTSVTDGCLGDEGGAILCNTNGRNWVVRGLVPFNLCANKQYNMFVTDVAPYMQWIKQTMATY